MKYKSKFKDSLHLFCKELGIPYKVLLDRSGENAFSAVKHFSQQLNNTLQTLEESTQYVNRAKLYIDIHNPTRAHK
jgi:hypothetical protein